MAGDSQLYIILVVVVVVCIIIWCSKNNGSIDGVQLNPYCRNVVNGAYKYCQMECSNDYSRDYERICNANCSNIRNKGLYKCSHY